MITKFISHTCKSSTHHIHYPILRFSYNEYYIPHGNPWQFPITGNALRKIIIPRSLASLLTRERFQPHMPHRRPSQPNTARAAQENLMIYRLQAQMRDLCSESRRVKRASAREPRIHSLRNPGAAAAPPPDKSSPARQGTPPAAFGGRCTAKIFCGAKINGSRGGGSPSENLHAQMQPR